jgi:hypothetical protein
VEHFRKELRDMLEPGTAPQCGQCKEDFDDEDSVVSVL